MENKTNELKAKELNYLISILPKSWNEERRQEEIAKLEKVYFWGY